jgi:hypothetical protein
MTRSLYCALFLLLAGTAAHAQFRAIRETNFKKVYVDSTLWVNYLQSAGHVTMRWSSMTALTNSSRACPLLPAAAVRVRTSRSRGQAAGDVSGTATGTTSLTPSLSLSAASLRQAPSAAAPRYPLSPMTPKGVSPPVSSTGISGANGGTVT